MPANDLKNPAVDLTEYSCIFTVFNYPANGGRTTGFRAVKARTAFFYGCRRNHLHFGAHMI